MSAQCPKCNRPAKAVFDEFETAMQRVKHHNPNRNDCIITNAMYEQLRVDDDHKQIIKDLDELRNGAEPAVEVDAEPENEDEPVAPVAPPVVEPIAQIEPDESEAE